MAQTIGHGSATTGERPSASGEERSTRELMSQLFEQVARLVRDEMRLAWHEVQHKARRAGLGGGLFGTAGVLSLYGGGAVVAGLIILLSRVLPAWISAFVIGAVLFAVAGLAALVGRRQLRRATPGLPEQTMASLRDDVHVIRERTRS